MSLIAAGLVAAVLVAAVLVVGLHGGGPVVG